MEILSDTTFRGKITVTGDGIEFSKDYEGTTYTSKIDHVLTNTGGYVKQDLHINGLKVDGLSVFTDMFVGDKPSSTFGILSVYGGVDVTGAIGLNNETISKWSDISQYLTSSPTGYKTDLLELPSPNGTCTRLTAATIGIANDYLGTKGLPKVQIFKKSDSDGSYKKVDCDVILKSNNESPGLTDVILEFVPGSLSICGANQGYTFWMSLDYLSTERLI